MKVSKIVSFTPRQVHDLRVLISALVNIREHNDGSLGDITKYSTLPLFKSEVYGMSRTHNIHGLLDKLHEEV